MTAHTDQMSVCLPCHKCGYDLRAHARDGQCPECGASVAESARLAAIPLRPAWRDSDPRWRRRMLAGTWVLVQLPLMDALTAFGWASSVPVPGVFDLRGTVRTLDETFLCRMGVYQPLVFCIGVVLLFSKERGRRRGKLDWTRRWGVVCSYVVLLLSAAQVLFLAALVMASIAALFQAMPLKYQPGVTQLFVEVSTSYLRYGPYPKEISGAVLVAFSSTAILLACVPLFEALRSSGPERVAAILLAPLGLFALVHIARAGRYCAGLSGVTSAELFSYRIYFWPELLVAEFAGGRTAWNASGSLVGAIVEGVKWCIILAIAVWLTVALVAAWWHRRGPVQHASPAVPPLGERSSDEIDQRGGARDHGVRVDGTAM